MNESIRVGEPTESSIPKIIRCYDDAVNAEIFAHTRECNIRTSARPGKGCDCELGKLEQAVEEARKSFKTGRPSPDRTTPESLVKKAKPAPPSPVAPHVAAPVAAGAPAPVGAATRKA